MKRSEINRQIAWAIGLTRKVNFSLPAFAHWTAPDWVRSRDRLENIAGVMQGWDVTDYGSGQFDKIGAVLFTLRNGSIYDSRMGTPYAEKIIAMKAGQMLPLHFHYTKTEDIINRAGGTLHLKLYNSKGPQYEVDYESPVDVYMDGILHTFRPGETVEVNTGNSITLTPYTYHAFWAKEEDGDLLIGEVSSINDDAKDNRFAEPFQMPPVEEDEPAVYLLCSEYNTL